MGKQTRQGWFKLDDEILTLGMPLVDHLDGEVWEMHTSRAALNRLLDATDTSLTLTTLASAAAALGRQVSFELRPA